MWAFKRRIARLATTLSFTTTKNDSYWRPDMAARDVPACPGWPFFWVYTPLIQKVTNRLSFSFYRRCAIHFWLGTEKRVKTEPLVFLIYSKNMRGGEKSAPPSRARVNMLNYLNVKTPLGNGIGVCKVSVLFTRCIDIAWKLSENCVKIKWGGGTLFYPSALRGWRQCSAPAGLICDWLCVCVGGGVTPLASVPKILNSI